MEQVVEYTKGEGQGRSFQIMPGQSREAEQFQTQILLLLSGGSSFGPWQTARRQL